MADSTTAWTDKAYEQIWATGGNIMRLRTTRYLAAATVAMTALLAGGGWTAFPATAYAGFLDEFKRSVDQLNCATGSPNCKKAPDKKQQPQAAKPKPAAPAPAKDSKPAQAAKPSAPAVAGAAVGAGAVAAGAATAAFGANTPPVVACAQSSERIAVETAEGTTEVFPQLALSTSINSITVSPDGKWLASAGDDKLVRLWDVESGREIRRFVGHTAPINSIAFSPDCRWLASGGEDKIVRLWDVSSGREVRRFEGHEDHISSVAFSPNSRILAAATKGFSNGDLINKNSETGIIAWHMESGKKTGILKSGEDVLSIAFSPDSKILAAKTTNGYAVISVDKWKTIASSGDLNSQGDSVAGSGKKVEFFPNGERIVWGNDTDIEIFDIKKMKVIKKFRLEEYGGGCLSGIQSIILSPDGNSFIISGCRQIKSININTGKISKIIDNRENIEGYWSSYSFVSYLSGGKKFIFSEGGSPADEAGHGKRESAMRVFDAATQAEVLRFGGQSVPLEALTYSPDGRSLVSRDADSRRMWDMASGIQINQDRTRTATRRWITDISEDHMTLKVTDTLTGNAIGSFKVDEGEISDPDVSPDGRWVISGGTRITIWDAQSGKKIRELPNDAMCAGGTPGSAIPRFYSSGRWMVPFTGAFCSLSVEDGNNLNNNSYVFDVINNKKIFELGSIDNPAFSVDGRFMLNTSSTTDEDLYKEITLKAEREKREIREDELKLMNKASIDIIEMASGKKLRSVPISVNPIFLPGTSVFSPDSRAFATSSLDGSVKLIDVESGRELRSLPNSNGHDPALFSPDGHRLLTQAGDGTMHLWNVDTGKPIARFVAFPNGEWLTITPEGYYTASATADRYLNVRVDNDNSKVYSIEQFAAVYYRPDIVQRALELGDSAEAVRQLATGAVATKIQDVLPPKVTIVSPANKAEVDQEYIDVEVVTEDVADTTDAVTFLVGGKALAVEKGKPAFPVASATGGDGKAEKKTYTARRSVRLLHGSNWITVEARGSKGAVESRTILVTRKGEPPRKPDLYLLAVGVAKHSGRMSLTYPAIDANGIVTALKAQEGRRYRSVHVVTLADAEATRDRIQQEAQTLFARAQQEDAAVVYISGHGINDPNAGYHYVTYDADPARLKDTGLPWTFFNKLLGELKAQVVLLADTCHSGNILDGGVPGPAAVGGETFTRELVRSNVFVFASSTGDKTSLESSSWGGGAFAAALIEGLKGKAAFRNDTVTVSYLQEYVKEQVIKMTEGQQTPYNPPISDKMVNFAVAQKVTAP